MLDNSLCYYIPNALRLEGQSARIVGIIVVLSAQVLCIEGLDTC